MRLGQIVLTKYKGKVKEFKVYKTSQDEVYLIANDIKITRKYWEVQKRRI